MRNQKLCRFIALIGKQIGYACELFMFNWTKSIVLFCAFVIFGNENVFGESKDVTMQVGETQTLYLPSSVTSKNLKSVVFYSNGISYVQVQSYTNYSVKVKAIKAFSSPIIVRCDYYYYVNSGSYNYQAKGFYDFNVTVVGETTVKPTSIKLPTVISVEVGESKQLSPEVLPANAEYTLTWSISDNSVASISNNGLLTGKSVGYADLKVKADNGVYTMSRISVYKPSATSVSVSPSTLSLKEGDSYSLSAIVYPSNASNALTWSSSNISVAKVSSTGRVNAIGSGSCMIKAITENGKIGICNLTVTRPVILPNSISIPESLTLQVGDTHNLIVQIQPENAVTSLTWTSSNNTVAKVSNSGTITALGEGTCRITVSSENEKSATCQLTVKKNIVLPENIVIPKSLTLTIGDSIAVIPEIIPANAQTSLSWTSSDETIAKVTSNGSIYAIGNGICIITASTENGKNASCEVTITAPTVHPTSIIVQENLEIEVDSEILLSVEVLPVESKTDLTWCSSNEGIAKVENGKVKAISVGTCVITVTTDNGICTSCNVNVKDKTIIPTDSITESWDGTYLFTSNITHFTKSEIGFNDNFNVTISNKQNTLYITSMLGCNTVYIIYEGLELRIVDDYHAEINLEYNDNLGCPLEDGYYANLHLLSPDEEYNYNLNKVIRLTRTDDKNITIEDFYVYAFGLDTDFEYLKEVKFSNCVGRKVTYNATRIETDTFEDNSFISIFDMSGHAVYRGNRNNTPLLPKGTYIVKDGRYSKKVILGH